MFAMLDKQFFTPLALYANYLPITVEGYLV